MAEDYILNTKIGVNTKEATSQLTKLHNQLVNSANKVDNLQRKLDGLKAKQIPTESYTKLQEELKKAEEELQKFVTKENELESIGVTSGSVFDALIEDEARASDRIDEIKRKMAELEASGKAFEHSEDTTEIEKLNSDLEKEKRNLEGIAQRYNEVKEKTEEAKEKQEELAKGDGFFTKLGKRIESFGKTMLKLFGFATLLRAIRNAFQSVIGMAKEGLQNLAQYSNEYNQTMSALKSSMATLKNSLATAFEPILNVIVPYLTLLVDKLIEASNAVAQFFSALSGKTYFTKAKKQMIDYAKTVKDSNKSLAKFDELNVLNDNKGGELTGANAFETAEIETKIATFASKVKALMDEVKTSFSNWWGDLDFSPLITSFENLKTSISPLIDSMGSGLMWFFENVLQPLGTFVIEQALPTTLNTIGKAFEFINKAIEVLSPVFENLWEKVLKPIGEYLEETFVWAIELVGDTIEDLTELITEKSDSIQNILNAIVNAWELAWQVIKNGLNISKAIIKTVIEYIVKIIGHIIDALDGVIEFIEGVFTGDWKKAVHGLAKMGAGLVNVIIDIVEGLINTVINAVNSLNFDIPDWIPLIGGKTYGFGNIPNVNWGRIEVPALASGGVTTGATLAQIGEAGKEAVLPLENNTGWMDALADKLSQRIDVTFQVESDANRIFKVVQKEANIYSRRTGAPAF